MSRNSLVAVLLWLILGSVSFASASEKNDYSEDALIIKALLEEESSKFSDSILTYEQLYQITGKKEYLIQEAKNRLLQKSDPSPSISSLIQWITKYPEDRDLELYRMLVALYIEQGSIEDAENVADEYLSIDTPAEDQVAVAALKLELDKPNEAVQLLHRAYKQNPDENTLLQIATITDKYLGKPKKAIKLLDDHINNHEDVSVGVYFKLIELYAKDKKLDKVSNIYKKLYAKDPQKYFLQKIIEISLYKNDIDSIISFLENNKGNEEILFTFYREKKLFKKAIPIVQKLYRTTKNPRWLAEEGMLIYEDAKDRSRAVNPTVLRQMQVLLEKALANGLKDALYLNYYGYTLIDYDLDIDKGINLLKKALKQDPKNTYYLDSLAWGLYKKGKCGRAYEIMRGVVAQEGLKEEEIRIHWNLIKKCYLKER